MSRHKCHHTRMNRALGHRTATLRNLAKALIQHEMIETTTTKAKTLRPFIEKVITLGKQGTMHHRRQAFSKLADKQAVHKVFEELAPRYKERKGGYTRIIHSRTRPGDASEMAYIELVDKVAAPKTKAKAAATDEERPASV